MGDTGPTTGRRVLVAGATGYIGGAVADALQRRGDIVTALVRPGTRHATLPCPVLAVDLTDATQARQALERLQIDVVVSCLASRSGAPDDAWAVDHGANVALLAAAEHGGAGHFQLLSAICVQRPQLAFQHAKLAFEARLRAARIDHSIVRPTAFFKSLSGQIERVLAGKPCLLFGDGTATACKPISRDDLARYLLHVLDTPTLHNQTLLVGGPGPALTPRAQGELLFELTGRSPRFRHVPVALFDVAERCLAPLGRFSSRYAERAEFARIGRYYATESMLPWDASREAYDAAATPSYGTETLANHYRTLLETGTYTARDEAQRLF